MEQISIPLIEKITGLMKFIIVILKDVMFMKRRNIIRTLPWNNKKEKNKDKKKKINKPNKQDPSVFGSIVQKECIDYITSWRIIILLIIILLTCLGSLYTSITTIND